MSKRSSPQFSKNTPAPGPGSQAASSDSTADFDADRFRLRRFPLTPLVAIVIGVGVVLVLIVAGWANRSAGPDALRHADIADPERELCQQFLLLKKAGDPAADALLAPRAAQPEQPLSQEEAARFQTNCFLHQDIRILAARRDAQGRLVLFTKGNVSAPTLEVRTARGVDRVQRTMVNPDLIVEVRDGTIHGLRAEMHTGR